MKKITISAIETWDVKRPIPYDKNAKLHPDSQVEQIANSITEFEFLDPIAVDEKGVILEGHGRLLAAQKLNLATVPVIIISGLSKEQKIAYRLAHNKISHNSGFNPELLQDELSFLDDNNFDIELTGFTLDDLNFGEDLLDWEEPFKQESIEPEETVLKLKIATEYKQPLLDALDITKPNPSANELGNALINYLQL
jgi:hypothetical protein